MNETPDTSDTPDEELDEGAVTEGMGPGTEAEDEDAEYDVDPEGEE